MSTGFAAGPNDTAVIGHFALPSDQKTVSSEQERTARFMPKMPGSLEQAGISSGLVEDLFLRHVHLKRCNTIGATCDSMALAYPIVERIFRDLRNQRLLEVSGMVGDDYVFTLTGAGRTLASERCRMC